MIRAQGAVAGGLAAAARHGWNVVTHPTSPGRMAARVRLLEGLDLSGELERLSVPTLICTGEDDLDYVVPPAMTREYALLWPHARVEVLRRTGHLGIISRPDELARVLDAFLASHDTGDEGRRSIG
jgi:pimeloyl-ACP methyl ester carboxylesterase